MIAPLQERQSFLARYRLEAYIPITITEMEISSGVAIGHTNHQSIYFIYLKNLPTVYNC